MSSASAAAAWLESKQVSDPDGVAKVGYRHQAGISILLSRLRTTIPPFASAGDLFCIRSRAKEPDAPGRAFARIKRP
jgi:hypothetical protein